MTLLIERPTNYLGKVVFTDCEGHQVHISDEIQAGEPCLDIRVFKKLTGPGFSEGRRILLNRQQAGELSELLLRFARDGGL